MIARLVALKAFADGAVSLAFGGARAFADALRDAFHAGMRARRVKPAELLARHLDARLRAGQGGAGDAEYDKVLDAALALHRFTEDKDVFRRFYHRLLAKRLLLARAASDDFEKAMVKRLSQRAPPCCPARAHS
jgi:cullin-4